MNNSYVAGQPMANEHLLQLLGPLCGMVRKLHVQAFTVSTPRNGSNRIMSWITKIFESEQATLSLTEGVRVIDYSVLTCCRMHCIILSMKGISIAHRFMQNRLTGQE